MRVLLAGYGNTGRAIDALIVSYPAMSVSSVHICDKKIHGITAQEWLRDRHQLVDVVINLTGESPWELLSLCERYRLDYIDSAIDMPENAVRNVETCYQALRSRSHDNRILVGFGMNPGLVEYIYHTAKPDTLHTAIELEYDTAWRPQPGVFSTWSPQAYFYEAIAFAPYYYTRKSQHAFCHPPAIELDTHLSLDSVARRFNVLPHAEVVSMGKSSALCEACAFLYQPPVTMQEFMKANWSRLDATSVQDIPTPGDGLQGCDTVGMLIHTGASRTPYFYNSASHALCSHRFKDRYDRGVNGTCWQVACGLCVALQLLSHLRPGAYNMTDVAASWSRQIRRVLIDIGFAIERRDYDVDELPWRNIASVLGLSSAQKEAVL